MKLKKRFNNLDDAVYTLGSIGVTEKESIRPQEAIDKIAVGVGKSISTAKKVFYQAVKNKLLVNDGEKSVKYCFTPEGFKQFIHIKEDVEKYYYESTKNNKSLELKKVIGVKKIGVGESIVLEVGDQIILYEVDDKIIIEKMK